MINLNRYCDWKQFYDVASQLVDFSDPSQPVGLASRLMGSLVDVSLINDIECIIAAGEDGMNYDSGVCFGRVVSLVTDTQL